MIFKPLIEEWGALTLAADLGLPAKNVRRWEDQDSIPAEWFTAVAKAARRRGKRGITEKHLAELAERRRLEKQGAV